ncbi:hypothetical protein QE152_g37203 [Popillia japonica]|uniref:Transposable element P transposase n=1 Tax=Popillia japonica TaxID=7064 RepID=A0AAW1IAY7_POPJA
MKVNLAAQVFSRTVSAVMRGIITHGSTSFSGDAIGTADFLLFMNKLFGSMNGTTVSPKELSNLKSAVQPNSTHMEFWANAAYTLDSMYFIKQNGSKFRPPTIKNWLETIKGFRYLWGKLQQEGFQYFPTRSCNRDPLEIFFGQTRSQECRNGDPTCFSFATAFKTLIINNFMSPHSLNANCEEDHCEEALSNLKQLLHIHSQAKQLLDVPNDISGVMLANPMLEIATNMDNSASDSFSTIIEDAEIIIKYIPEHNPTELNCDIFQPVTDSIVFTQDVILTENAIAYEVSKSIEMNKENVEKVNPVNLTQEEELNNTQNVITEVSENAEVKNKENNEQETADIMKNRQAKKCVRKILRNPEKWKSNIRKKLCQAGKEYVPEKWKSNIRKKLCQAVDAEKVQKPVYTTHTTDDEGTAKKDMRGRTGIAKIADERKQIVIDHIKMFNVVESHYCRAKTNRKYLEANLTLPKMYQMYLTYCEENIISTPVKMSMYRRIFSTNCNYGFHKPKQDVCEICFNYHLKVKESRLTDTENQEVERHFKEKDDMRKEKENDKEKDDMRKEKENDKKSGIPVLCFDLENVVPCPKSFVENHFYLPKLSMYNLTAHLSTTNKAYCAVWIESLQGRSGNCIASAFKKIVERCPNRNVIPVTGFHPGELARYKKNLLCRDNGRPSITISDKTISLVHQLVTFANTETDSDPTSLVQHPPTSVDAETHTQSTPVVDHPIENHTQPTPVVGKTPSSFRLYVSKILDIATDGYMSQFCKRHNQTTKFLDTSKIVTIQPEL